MFKIGDKENIYIALIPFFTTSKRPKDPCLQYWLARHIVMDYTYNLISIHIFLLLNGNYAAKWYSFFTYVRDFFKSVGKHMTIFIYKTFSIVFKTVKSYDRHTLSHCITRRYIFTIYHHGVTISINQIAMVILPHFIMYFSPTITKWFRIIIWKPWFS